MKKFITLIAMLAIAGIASADIVTYDTFTGGTSSATIALDAGHTWLDPNTSAAAGLADSMYFGGTIQVTRTGTALWSDYFSFGVSSSVDAMGAHLVEPAGGGDPNTEFDGTSASVEVTELAGWSFSEIAWQIKIVDDGYNQADAHLFIGDNAESMTEGTADYIVSITALTANSIDQFYLNVAGATTVTLGGLGTQTGIASSTEWIAVPEPATVGMLGLGALVALLIRRIRA